LLDQLSVSFNTVNNRAVESNQINLNDYQTVIYFVGDESVHSESLSAVEQEKLKQFLENGGNLLLSGSNIGYDLIANGSFSDSLFYNNYLHSFFAGDSAAGNQVIGHHSSFLNNLTATLNLPGLKNDILIPNFADTLITYNDGSVGGLAFSGQFGSSQNNGKLVYLAFPFELLEDKNIRQEIFVKIMEYFDITTAITGNPVLAIPKNVSLLGNYPNPFNPSTKIVFKINNSSHVKLEIFDIYGKSVKLLSENRFAPGIHHFLWNGQNKNGESVSTGIYILKMTASGQVFSKKIMLLR